MRSHGVGGITQRKQFKLKITTCQQKRSFHFPKKLILNMSIYTENYTESYLRNKNKKQ